MTGLRGDEVACMRYFKITSNGYIESVGTGYGGTEIAKSEYDEIMTAIRNKPQSAEDTDYLLKDDLTWEAYHVEPVEPEADAEEIVSILLGGAL